jgi:hypothetical protein
LNPDLRNCDQPGAHVRSSNLGRAGCKQRGWACVMLQTCQTLVLARFRLRGGQQCPSRATLLDEQPLHSSRESLQFRSYDPFRDYIDHERVTRS